MRSFCPSARLIPEQLVHNCLRVCPWAWNSWVTRVSQVGRDVWGYLVYLVYLVPLPKAGPVLRSFSRWILDFWGWNLHNLPRHHGPASFLTSGIFMVKICMYSNKTTSDSIDDDCSTVRDHSMGTIRMGTALDSYWFAHFEEYRAGKQVHSNTVNWYCVIAVNKVTIKRKNIKVKLPDKIAFQLNDLIGGFIRGKKTTKVARTS